MYGDSIPAGTGYGVRYPVTDFNRAVGGENTSQSYARWQADAEVQDNVLIHSGINDLAGGASKETTWSRIQTFIDAVLLSGKVCYVGTITPTRDAWFWSAGFQASVEWVNDQIRAYAGITAVDFYSVLDDGTGKLRTEFNLGDHVHMSFSGHDRLRIKLYEGY